MANFPTSLTRSAVLGECGGYQSDQAVVRVQPEAGPVLTRQRTTSPQKIFTLYYANMTSTDCTTLTTFESGDAAYGAGEFTWTHPVNSATYTCILESPIEYIPSKQRGDLWDFRIRLRGR